VKEQDIWGLVREGRGDETGGRGLKREREGMRGRMNIVLVAMDENGRKRRFAGAQKKMRCGAVRCRPVQVQVGPTSEVVFVVLSRRFQCRVPFCWPKSQRAKIARSLRSVAIVLLLELLQRQTGGGGSRWARWDPDVGKGSWEDTASKRQGFELPAVAS